ncbi:MAG: 30S ribosome-binding factor RbfA [candidate division WOR-3 bacterium]
MLWRDQRTAELIRVEIAKIITSELADPKLGFVTVIGVKVTKDLKKAFVYVSVIGDDAKKKESVEHLEHARNYIRGLLRRRIVLRYLPEIHFEYDRLFEQEQRVSQLLSELHATEEPKGNP